MSSFLFLLTKLIPVPFYPLGLVITFGITAIIFISFGKARVGRMFLFLSIGMMIFFSLPAVAYTLAKPLEMKYPQKIDYPPTAAVVLLAGGEVAPAPPRIFTEVNSAGDRILHAVRLFKHGLAPRIVITGGKLPLVSAVDSSVSSLTASLLTQVFDIDDEYIVLEEQAKNTAEHGIYLRELFETKKWPTEIILVTSALHMYRSVKVLEKQGFRVHPAPTDFRSNNDIFKTIMHFLPNASALELCTGIFHEVYGICAYKLMGKL